eukprot:UN12961
MVTLKVGIATSSNRESVKHLLQRLGANSVDDFVAAEDYSESKPDPECFLLLASKLGVKPRDCLVFEDSVAGVQAARKAGMKVIAIGQGNKKQDES